MIINKENYDSEVQKIKSHLDTTYLKYVSNNVKNLLNINTHFKIIVQTDKYRVILYIRLSVEDGDVSKSIKNQLLILLDECKKRDW